MRRLQFNDWTIEENAHSAFYAWTGAGETLYFIAEYRNGVYFSIKSYCRNGRCYTAQRYFHRLIPLVSNMTRALLRSEMLWDYKNDRPGLVSYKKDIRPYYEKCKILHLPFYDDTEFLEKLFNDN